MLTALEILAAFDIYHFSSFLELELQLMLASGEDN